MPSLRFKNVIHLVLAFIFVSVLTACGSDNGGTGRTYTGEELKSRPGEETYVDRKTKEYAERKAKEEADYQAKLAAGDPEALKLKKDLEEIDASNKEGAQASTSTRSPQPSATTTPTQKTPDAPTAEGTVLKYEDVPSGPVVEIFKVGNDKAVSNGGTPPVFSITTPYRFNDLWTYHWNGGKGQSPGTIALKAADGTIYGPWSTELVNGVYWKAQPEITIPAGKYSVIDSDPSTFAQNSDTAGQGMAWANGIQVK